MKAIICIVHSIFLGIAGGLLVLVGIYRGGDAVAIIAGVALLATAINVFRY